MSPVGVGPPKRRSGAPGPGDRTDAQWEGMNHLPTDKSGPHEPEVVIRARELGRDFGSLCAVQSLSFEVYGGEIFGFLGPNGAGKTTTIRMLTAQLPPSRGDALVAGYDVASQPARVKGQIGVVFEAQNLYDRLTVQMNLECFCGLYGTGKDRIDEVLEQVELTARRRDPVRNLSRGLRQRLCIARSLLPRPQLLFLDEPTSGLDPHAARALRKLVRRLADGDTTIFLTTHYMEEADQLCDRVAIIDHGRMVALDSPVRLKALHARADKAKGEAASDPVSLEVVYLALTGKSLEA